MVLASLVLGGIGAAATAAAWVDETHYTATAAASSFDIQARTSVDGEWLDVGLPGDPDTDLAGNEIVLDGIEDALPGTSYAVPIFLCNAGGADGIIADAEIDVDGTLVDLASVNVDTISLGTVLPANSCNDTDQVAGFIQLTTIADWGAERSGILDVIRIRILCESV
ncbi:hypothetical protein ASF62_05785 [Leifsonia sp. Leaf325]|nr:hypothetical protein [Leifsonia sp. Leaf325]KQQ93716.1 hypothetical protein ASF62_05785 [Leifsonia sp. Leaf325]